jgi:hypothetical protein
MKTYFLIVFLLLSQISFGKGNFVFFEGLNNFLLSENEAKNQLNFKLNLKVGIEKWNEQNISSKYPKIEKAKIITLASLFNTLNICLLILFVILYFMLIYGIQLIHKHYMELE